MTRVSCSRIHRTPTRFPPWVTDRLSSMYNSFSTPLKKAQSMGAKPSANRRSCWQFPYAKPFEMRLGRLVPKQAKSRCRRRQPARQFGGRSKSASTRERRQSPPPVRWKTKADHARENFPPFREQHHRAHRNVGGHYDV